MIETVMIDNKPVNLSLNAESITLPDGKLPAFYTAKQISRSKKRYYTQAEGFMFFDDQPGVSIAAQLVQWINTDIATGEHHIYIPGDHTIYHAHIQVQETYVLVEREELLEFDKTLSLIKSNPLQSQIHRCGQLNHAFAQHQVETTDLLFNLDGNNTNPAWLRAGYSANQVILAGGAAVGLLVAAVSYANFLQTPEQHRPDTTGIQTIVIPKSTTRIATDVAALENLLGSLEVFLAYGLKDVSISRTQGTNYSVSAGGDYRQSYPLSRLYQLARQVDAAITIQGQSWLLRGNLYRPSEGEETPLIPLETSFQQYQQLAARAGMKLSIGGLTRHRNRVAAGITLSMDYPSPQTIRHAAALLRENPLHGQLSQARLSIGNNAAWQELILSINVTGH
ncbi:MAG: hypothetical protein OXE42_03630 [Gammaproteobacteria bacterium]|nr:hypothetical protein [Gammaproteobacteria bacterium]